jgi:hypothetical protein
MGVSAPAGSRGRRTPFAGISRIRFQGWLLNRETRLASDAPGGNLNLTPLRSRGQIAIAAHRPPDDAIRSRSTSPTSLGARDSHSTPFGVIM